MSNMYAESAQMSAPLWTDEAHKTLPRLERTSATTGGTGLAAKLSELQVFLAADLQALQASLLEIEAELSLPASYGSTDRARLAARHLVGLPGKRIRPMCVVLAARLGGLGLTPEVRKLALASELVHAATLLHDDVIDEGTERRGMPTARRVFGNSASVLAGDHLLVRALQLVAATGVPFVLPRMLSVIDAMITAESIQLASRIEPDLSSETLVSVIRGKTGSLFAWCMEAGGVAAGLGDEATVRLARVGMSGGIAFQLADDVLDLSGDADMLGKATLTDLREGKVTWPVRVALDKDRSLMELVRRAAEEEVPGPACQALALAVKSSGAVEETQRAARGYLNDALENLSGFAPGPARSAIEVILSAFVDRNK